MSRLSRSQLQGRLAALHQASLEIVQDISLESLLERIAVIACEQVGARFAALGVLNDNGQIEQFIPVGMSQEEVARMDHSPSGLGLIGALMSSTKAIRLDDIRSDPRFSGFPQFHPEMHTFLGVPILLGTRQFGSIYLTDKKDGAVFNDEDQQVIETLAAYAAIAISNARFYRQLTKRDRLLTERNENLALLNQLASTLVSSPDIDQILDKALTHVMDYLRFEVGEFYVAQEDSTILRLVLHRGSEVHTLWRSSQYSIGEGVVGMTAQQNIARVINLDEREYEDLSDEVLDSDFHHVACFPLSGRRGAVGVLSVGSTQVKSLDEPAMVFLSAISLWVGMTIENVRLNIQQRRLAILEERERIGMDLHDGIIQSIYAVGLILEHARLLLAENPQAAEKRIENAIHDLNNTIRDIRTYILDLRPRQFSNENLMEGVQRLVSEFRANTLIDVVLQGPPDGFKQLPEVQAKALFHICQESLANIAKHSRARHIEVTVWATSERALLEISDNGRGFDTGDVRMTLGHGLSNMVTRARGVDGDVDISSEPGMGTTILAWVPLEYRPPEGK
jgi:two-component system sensor histidine kinase DevS